LLFQVGEPAYANGSFFPGASTCDICDEFFSGQAFFLLLVTLGNERKRGSREVSGKQRWLEPLLLIAEKKNVLRVPELAIQRDGQQIYCLVQSGDKVEKRTITKGISDGKYIEIRDSLKEGDVVVVK
jgi:hypothetical protein